MRPWVVSVAEFVWRSKAPVARLGRGLLSPLAWMYRIGQARRNRRYDRLPPPPGLAALSVGNLTVGGTGKTPVAAWCVQQLRSQGAQPSVVMRGYGDDEWRVHMLLNPRVPVIVSPDRQHGVLTARTRGADCVVLDDAFQHRRVSRSVDLVLVSADSWPDRVRLLPAGAFREPLESLRRADVVVVTVKAATADVVTQVVQAITQSAPGVPVAVIRLEPDQLRLAVTIPASVERGRAKGQAVPASLTHAASWLSGRAITVATAIGDPAAFAQQLRGLGATIRHELRFPDHHTFSVADARRIATTSRDVDGVVCTLKDAVKLGVLWPREAPPLWYVSQTVVVERGAEALNRAFVRVLAARVTTAPTAG